MIVFEKVRYKNFLSSGNSFTEINLNDEKYNLIIGNNGSGKSSILDSISYVLYNKAYRKINLPQLVNSINQSDSLVEIEFTTGGKKYFVRRGQKPKVFEVYCDGKQLPQYASNRDCQRVFEEEILKFNHKTFCQIVVLSSTNFTPFLDLSAAQRREIVEEVLQLKLFTHMNVIAKENLKKEVNNLREIEYKIDLEESKKTNYEKLKNQAQENINDIIEYKQKSIDELNVLKNNLVVKLKEIKNEIEKNGYDNSIFVKFADEKRTFTNNLTSIIRNIGSLSDSLKRFDGISICNECGQDISKNHIEDHLKKTEDKIKVLKEKYREEKDKETDAISKFENYYEKKKKHDALLDTAQSIKNDYNNCVTKISEYEKEVETLKNKNTGFNEEELQEVSLKIDQFKNDLITVKENIFVLKQCVNMLKDDGIKSKIIKHYVPIINKSIEKYLNILEFHIGFTFDENFNEVIKSRYLDKFSYSSFSEGEKSRIDLALLFAWREIASLKNSVKTNILFMDEVLDSSIDNIGIDLLFELINTVEGNIFIISHRELFTDKISNYIKFEKIGHFSCIKED